MAENEFVCYHITTKDRMESILKEGLKPNAEPNWFKSKTPYVMLSLYPYWWLYQNRETWGLPDVAEDQVVLLEIKSDEIKPEFFNDPEGLRWGEVIPPTCINVAVDYKINEQWQAFKERSKGVSDGNNSL